MNEISTVARTGGTFILEPIGGRAVFSREQFNEEQHQIDQMMRDFASERIRPNTDQIETHDKELSLQLIQEMGGLGLLAVDVPEQYGGLDLDKTTAAIVAENMRFGWSSSFTTTFSVQTGIGMLPIVWFGTEQQKMKYLPKLATGEWIAAYALTESSSGSDATSAKTTAVLDRDGEYYLLNGEKQFISNGGWADVFTLFAQVDGQEFTAFLIDRDTPGLEIGPEEAKLGVRGSSTVPLILRDAKVPVDNVLGKVGDGATIAFNVLNIGRLKLGAATLGGCKEVTALAIKYALERRQFGQPIAYFDAIKGKIADMIVRTYALDSVIYRTYGLIDEAVAELDKSNPEYYLKMGEAMERFAIESSMSKIFGSESLGVCADHGIQIYGGYGFIEEYPMARIYRDTRIDRIWEGTSEINRQIVTGYFMKKALMNEIPIREKIKSVDSYLEQEQEVAGDGVLAYEMQIVEAGKHLALYIFNKALNEFGQDLKHHQQLGESLADNFIDLYSVDSTVARVKQIVECGGRDVVPVAISQVLTAEVSLRLLGRALTGLNDIYHGHLPEPIIDTLKRFQVRMLPRIDVSELKRQIAEHVYSQKRYPF